MPSCQALGWLSWTFEVIGYLLWAFVKPLTLVVGLVYFVWGFYSIF